MCAVRLLMQIYLHLYIHYSAVRVYWSTKTDNRSPNIDNDNIIIVLST